MYSLLVLTGVPETDERSTARNDYENTLRSIVSQVAVSVDGNTVHEGIMRRFDLDSRAVLAGIGLSSDECVQMLIDVFTSAPAGCRFTLVVDALDECLDYDSLLQELHNACSQNTNARVFFSSRFEVKVQDYFPEARCVEIREQNTNDIDRFLDTEIRRRRLGSGMTDIQVIRLRHVLTQRASGM